MGYKTESIKRHKETRGKLSVESKMSVSNQDELSIAYTPGVAGPCLEIAKDKNLAKELTSAKSTIAVVTDGTAVLGLGDIGPEAALPVMEGKAALFKEFAGVNAFPIALATTDVDEIVETVKRLAPSFGGINLEDISAPRCFAIEERLKKDLDMPVFHDDQHGTAVVVLAGLINALKVVGKDRESIRVVINGAGAAGIAITKLLTTYGIKEIYLVDSRGIVADCRDDLNTEKMAMIECCVAPNICGSLPDALAKADVFIGVSKGNILTQADVSRMNKDAIVFALANPTPEIDTEEALAGGARVVATGRSDRPNQLNNVLVFPGIFKGALEAGVRDITEEMMIAAAHALAGLVPEPTESRIIPDPFKPGVANTVAHAVIDHAQLKKSE